LGKIASIGIIARLLPVLDNLERAQEHLQDSGLAIAIGEFVNVLKDDGLSVINPNVGDRFDENTMEALEVVDTESDNDRSDEAKVAEVVLTGWKFSDGTVVRHAKVKVSKK
jgi:molecular chaperone GrpE